MVIPHLQKPNVAKKRDMGSFFTCAGGVSSPAHLPVVPEQRAELGAGAAKHAGPREARAFPSFLGGANFQISQIFKFSNQQKVKHFLSRKLILENGAKECIAVFNLHSREFLLAAPFR